MPGGKTHAVATLVAMATTITTMAAARADVGSIGACVTGFMLSMSVNPDLDLNSKFPRSRPAKWPQWIYWYPYSRLVKHRSAISHAPILGTAFRILYMAPLIAIPLLAVDIPHDILLWAVYGLTASDTVHVVLDIWATFSKTHRSA